MTNEGNLRRTDVGLDDTVYAVVFTDEDDREYWMQEVYTSEASARRHWRFRVSWGRPRQTEIRPVPYRDLIHRAYRVAGNANPFEAVANAEFRGIIGSEIAP